MFHEVFGRRASFYGDSEYKFTGELRGQNILQIGGHLAKLSARI